MLHDLRFALRMLRRRRGFAAIAVITVALGVGAATSIFSVVDGVLLRPLPFREAGRLVAIWQTYPEWRKEPILTAMWDRITLSIPEYRDLRDQQTAFEGVAIWNTGTAMLSPSAGGERLEQVFTVRASATMLDVLGVRPYLGRFFLPGDDTQNGPRVVVITYDAWRSRFGGERGVLSRQVELDGVAHAIVGVLPPGLSLGHERRSPGIAPVEFWTPVSQDGDNAEARRNHSYFAIGRLRAGIPLERATAEVDHILRGTEDASKKGFRLAAWGPDQTREARAPLAVLAWAVALLLLIACANVATLLLGEAATREHEMASRLAIGASRARLVRQLLTESLVLALAGAACGVLLAWWGTRALVALAPPRVPGLDDVHMNLRVLGFAVAASLTTGLLFGLAPAATLAREEVALALRTGAGQTARGRGALQRTLVALEIALSIVLLVGAGLLARSLDRLTRVDPGFHADGLVLLRPAMPRAMWKDSATVREIQRATRERILAVPGVVAATIATQPPFTGGSSSTSLVLEGESDPADGADRSGASTHPHEAQQRMIVPGYFATLGIPLLAGRDFTDADRDGAPLVVVVSEALARRDFPGGSPLGRRVKFQGQWRTIVGIVGDIHTVKLSRDVEATVYAPLAQRFWWSAAYIARVRGDAEPLVPALRAAVTSADPRLPTPGVDLIPDLVRRSFAEERYRTLLIALFAALAALSAAAGMYGVTSRAVNGRRREVGIRVALGASRASVVRLIVGHTLAGAIVGTLVGLAGALAAARLIEPFLFGVRTLDPATYVTILALLALVSGLASWLPARRAGRVEPAAVLRE